jgi:hypothetical protein
VSNNNVLGRKNGSALFLNLQKNRKSPKNDTLTLPCVLIVKQLKIPGIVSGTPNLERAVDHEFRFQVHD